MRMATIYVQPDGNVLVDIIPWELSGTIKSQNLYALTLVVLVLGTVLCALALRLSRLDVLAVAVTSAGVAGWLLSNYPGEGSTLLLVAPGNGLTRADLAAAPATVLVLVLAYRRLRAEHEADGAGGATRRGAASVDGGQ